MFLNGSLVVFGSSIQKIVYLYVTKVEMSAGVTCAQDMSYVMHIVEALGLKVKRPMGLTMDNKGEVNLANSWSVGGRTHHVNVKQYFLRDLKEDGVIQVNWVSGLENVSNGFTKNLGGPAHRKQVHVFCGTDEYNHDSED